MNWSSLLIIILTITTSYYIGSIIIYLSKCKLNEDEFYATFLKVIIGIITGTFLFAVFKSNGNTILWAFPLIGLFYIFDNKKDILNLKNGNSDIFKFNKTKLYSLSTILVIAIGYFILQGYFFYHVPFNNIQDQDQPFYTLLSQFLNLTGTESTTFSIDPINLNNAATPYHYFEMWFSAIFISLGANSLETYTIISYVIFSSLASYGLLIIARHYTKNIIILLISIISIYYTKLIPFDAILGVWIPQIGNSMYNLKTIVVMIFYIWFVLLILKKNKYYRLIVLFIPIINILTAPSVFISLFLTHIVLWYRNKRKTYQSFLYSIVPMLTLSAFFLFFYTIQPNPENNIISLNIISEWISNNTLVIIKCIILLSISFLLITSFWIFPIIVFSFSKKKSFLFKQFTENRVLFEYYIILFFTSSTIWLLTDPIKDSYQFYMIPMQIIPIINFLLLLFLLKFIEHYKSMKKLAIIYVSIISITNLYLCVTENYRSFSTVNYSEEYVKQCQLSLNPNKPYHIGAKITKFDWDEEFYGENSTKLKTSPFIPFTTNNIYTISLNSLECPYYKYSKKNENYYKPIIKNNPFSKYANSYISEHGKTSLDKLQYEFIKSNNIDFIIFEKGTKIPAIIKSNIAKIYIDSNTGEQFIIIN